MFRLPIPRSSGRRTFAPALVTFSLAILWVLLAPLPALAGDGQPGFHLELAASTLGANAVSPDQIVGLRGSHGLSRRWAIEGGLFRLTEDQVWLGDLSAKLYLHSGRKNHLFLSGGPSFLYLPDEGERETLAHLGVGAELALSERLYLRPEVRGRWFVRDFGAISIVDLSLGFGWRF